MAGHTMQRHVRHQSLNDSEQQSRHLLDLLVLQQRSHDGCDTLAAVHGRQVRLECRLALREWLP